MKNKAGALEIVGLLLCGLLLMQAPAFSQTSSLPACQGEYDLTTWTKCFGKRINPNGEIYVGGFLNGVAHGRGTYTFPSGTKYVGEYKNGRRDGVGTEYRADGTVTATGRWVKGVLQKETTKSVDDKPDVKGQTDAVVASKTEAKGVTKNKNEVADSGSELVERISLLDTLLTKRWKLSPTLDCQRGGGSYGVYDKKEGRYFVNNGLVDKASRQPEVDIKEVDANNVVILINYLATPLIEKALNEKKVFATQLELTITRDRQGRITETERAVLMDARSAMEGVKKFKNELPDPSELVACEGESFATEPDTGDRYNGRAKLRCDVNVDCANQQDVAAKLKIKGERGLKTNQAWAQACLEASVQAAQATGAWTSESPTTGLNICNGEQSH